MYNISDLSPLRHSDTTAHENLPLNRWPNASRARNRKSLKPSHFSSNSNTLINAKNAPPPEAVPNKYNLAKSIKKTEKVISPDFKLKHGKSNGTPEICIGDESDYQPVFHTKKFPVEVRISTRDGTPANRSPAGGDSKHETFTDKSVDEISSERLPESGALQNKVELKKVCATEDEKAKSSEETFMTADTHFDTTSAGSLRTRRNLWRNTVPPLGKSRPSYYSPRVHFYGSPVRKGLKKAWSVTQSNTPTHDGSNKRQLRAEETLDLSDQSSNCPCDSYSTNQHLIKKKSGDSYQSNPCSLKLSDQSGDLSSDITSVIFESRQWKWPVEAGSNRNYIRALVHRNDTWVRTDVIESAKEPRPHWIVHYDNVNYIKSFMSPNSLWKA